MLDTILHYFAVLIGFGFLYCGLLLYEKEENALHNRLDNCWKMLDQKGRKAVRQHAGLLQEFACIAFYAVERICGSKVWSLQNFFATACISIASVASFALLGVLVLHQQIPTSSIIKIISQEGVTAIVFTTLFLLPLVKWTASRIRVWEILVSCAWVFLYVHANGNPYEFSLWGFLRYFDWLVLWIALVMGFMVFSRLTKMVLNTIIETSIGTKSVLAALIYLILITGTALAIKMNCHLIQDADHHGTFFVSTDNIFVGIFVFLGFFGSMWLNFALLVFCALLLLFLHSVIWGSIKRPIYAMSRHKIFNRHKTLVSIGATLIALGFKIPTVTLEIIKAF